MSAFTISLSSLVLFLERLRVSLGHHFILAPIAVENLFPLQANRRHLQRISVI